MLIIIISCHLYETLDKKRVLSVVLIYKCWIMIGLIFLKEWILILPINLASVIFAITGTFLRKILDFNLKYVMAVMI